MRKVELYIKNYPNTIDIEKLDKVLTLLYKDTKDTLTALGYKRYEDEEKEARCKLYILTTNILIPALTLIKEKEYSFLPDYHAYDADLIKYIMDNPNSDPLKHFINYGRWVLLNYGDKGYHKSFDIVIDKLNKRKGK